MPMRNTSSSRMPNISSPSSLSGSPPVPPTLTQPTSHSTSASGKPSGYRQPPNFSNKNVNSPLVPYPAQYTNSGRPRQVSQTTRTAGPGGGMSVILGETESWTDLAKQDTTLPADAKDINAKPNGMLGFLSRKKGRGHSPKPMERGILGKEGARVVVSG
jgi:serine/threonine kinase 32